VRTIARVVVVPRFRGIGLGVQLVRHALAHAQTRYVEALAVMGRVQPFFEKAGMQRFERPQGPAEVRLLAAVESDAGKGNEALRKKENEGPMAQLMAMQTRDITPFLAAELRLFVKRKAAGVEGWLAEARERVGAVPVYYLWERT
jgi:GNAT superfamily N-acetyltransferase